MPPALVAPRGTRVAPPSPHRPPLPPAPWGTRRRGPFYEEAERLFQQASHVLEEARAHGPIHCAMVTGQREHHPAAYTHSARGVHHGHAAHGPHGEDRTLRRVDDRRELDDVVHPEIRD